MRIMTERFLLVLSQTGVNIYELCMFQLDGQQHKVYE